MTDSSDHVKCPECGSELISEPPKEAIASAMTVEEVEELQNQLSCTECGHIWQKEESEGGDSSSTVKGDSHSLSNGEEPPTHSDSSSELRGEAENQ